MGEGGIANSSSDEVGVVGRSELCELGLESTLRVSEEEDGDVDCRDGVEGVGKGGWGKLRDMSENVSRNESGDPERASTYAGELGTLNSHAGDEGEEREGDMGGDGADRGGISSVSSIENS